MRLRDFLPWSLLGTFLWATAFTLVGYAFHESFASAAHTLTHAALRGRGRGGGGPRLPRAPSGARGVGLAL